MAIVDLERRETCGPMICGGFLNLPAEIHNIIYAIAFQSSTSFFLAAAEKTAGQFRLHEKSEKAQHDAVKVLRTLSKVSREVRIEARTLFYASKHFVILGEEYEYLPILVRWLDVIGPECRGVLRKMCFTGHMWYDPCVNLTAQFHDLLRSCVSLRTLTVEFSLPHVYESRLPSLGLYIASLGDVSPWARSISKMPGLESFRLDLLATVDKDNNGLRNARYYWQTGERARKLGQNVNKRLREAI
ncbi:hypothetical protein GQ44DRAFT_827004 [Phaeosphaeriaceae sp. PMI808]|nr:hypothetical protein GQ44DRAFT_827004 [Phaeosphaeriaceae sp. PMI808]